MLQHIVHDDLFYASWGCVAGLRHGACAINNKMVNKTLFYWPILGVFEMFCVCKHRLH